MTSATFRSLFPQARTRVDSALVRIDRVLLRLQGRLDTGSADRVLPWAVALVLFGVLLSLSLARSRSLEMGLDLASYVQATWQIGEGERPMLTLTDSNLLSEQASFILYPLGVITSVLPRINTLLTLQALALAWVVVPLWRLARRQGNLRIGATSAVAFTYFFYAAIHAMNIADFHPETLAVPALFGAVLYGLEERKRIFVTLVVFAMLCRADLALVILGLGILLLIEGRRRLGVMALIGGIGWLFATLFILQPSFNDSFYVHGEAFVEFGSTPHGVLWGIITAPHEFLGLIFSEVNFRVLVTLLAPVLFLPLTAPRYLLPAVPAYALYIAADVPLGRLAEATQAIPMTVFVFVATVFALRRTGTILVERVNVDRRLLLAMVLTASVFFIRDSVTSPYEQPWSWGDRSSADVAMLEVIDEIPADAPIRASQRFLPRLAERTGLWPLDIDLEAVEVGDLDELDQVADGVDWVLFDPSDDPLWTDQVITQLEVRLANAGFERVPLSIESEMAVYQFTGVVTAAPAVEVDPSPNLLGGDS